MAFNTVLLFAMAIKFHISAQINNVDILNKKKPNEEYNHWAY